MAITLLTKIDGASAASGHRKRQAYRVGCPYDQQSDAHNRALEHIGYLFAGQRRKPRLDIRLLERCFIDQRSEGINSLAFFDLLDVGM